MIRAIFILILCAVTTIANAERYIVPTQYDDQFEELSQGASIIHSEKINSVYIYQTDETLDRQANFYFGIMNRSGAPINFHFANLRVTDQCGNPIRVIHKRELLANQRSQRNWRMFGSFICGVADHMNADQAGEINCYSRSSTSYNSNYRGNRGSHRYNASAYTTTQSTIHCEALRQDALRRASQDSAMRNAVIEDCYYDAEARIQNFYFDSNTLYPDAIYEANVQIDVPYKAEQNLQYLLFTFDLGQETHTFCFYCGQNVQ